MTDTIEKDRIYGLKKDLKSSLDVIEAKDKELSKLRSENEELRMKLGETVPDTETKKSFIQGLVLENSTLRAENEELKDELKFEQDKITNIYIPQAEKISDLRKEKEELKKIWNVPIGAECCICGKDCSKGSINIGYPELNATLVFCSVECHDKVDVKIKEISDLRKERDELKAKLEIIDREYRKLYEKHGSSKALTEAYEEFGISLNIMEERISKLTRKYGDLKSSIRAVIKEMDGAVWDEETPNRQMERFASDLKKIVGDK